MSSRILTLLGSDDTGWPTICPGTLVFAFFFFSSLLQHLSQTCRLLIWKRNLWLEFYLRLLLISCLKLWVQLCQSSFFVMWKETPCGSVKYTPFPLLSLDTFQSRLLWETFTLCTIGYVPIHLHLTCNNICYYHAHMVHISGALKSEKKERTNLILKPKFFIIIKCLLITCVYCWTRDIAALSKSSLHYALKLYR